MMSTRIAATILLILGLVFGSVAVVLPALLPPVDAVAIIAFGVAAVTSLFVFATNSSQRSLSLAGLRFMIFAFATRHEATINTFVAGARSALRRGTINATITFRTAHERLAHVQRAIAAHTHGTATTFALAPP
ncbi:MAG: hypothetical protein HYV55_02135 [Parcubacteria group bacterium]|nr:hypothetical protein [Parcubacteria group bacterium]